MTPAPRSAEQGADALADTAFPEFLTSFELSSRPAIVVAISGGSDSTALLLMARDWRDRVAPSSRILAATVDHGLRAEAAAEAGAVAAFCARLSIDHVTLQWTGAKPSTGIQAAARAARLGLLAEAARQAGTDIVLVGHTLDDQAETVAMRASRGPGIGLAGMAPATLVDGDVWFLRPMLRMRREALRAFLRARGVPWIDDPSNQNPAFERVRLRTAGLSADPARFDDAAHQRSELAERAAALVDLHATMPSRGLVRLDPAFFAAADRDAAVHAFRALLAAVGGVEQMPDAPRVATLFDRVRAPLRATLSRTLVDARRTGTFLLREERDLPGPCAAVDGMVWDGRFRLRHHGSPGSVVVPARCAVADVADVAVPASLARAALLAEPSLLKADDASESVALNEDTAPLAARRLALPWSRLLPSFDLPLAQAVARVVGAAPFPPSPFHGHNGAKA